MKRGCRALRKEESWMRRRLLSLMFLGGAMAALVPVDAGGQQTDNMQDYHALLTKQCPANHLEWLSEGELDDLIEVNFHDSLPESLQSKLDAADRREKQACANVTMGLSCFNTAYINAMGDAGLLSRFAKMVCASGLVCKASAECGKP